MHYQQTLITKAKRKLCFPCFLRGKKSVLCEGILPCNWKKTNRKKNKTFLWMLIIIVSSNDGFFSYLIRNELATNIELSWNWNQKVDQNVDLPLSIKSMLTLKQKLLIVIITHQVPVLPSYRNQSIDLQIK